jgi:hypothetical protein
MSSFGRKRLVHLGHGNKVISRKTRSPDILRADPLFPYSRGTAHHASRNSTSAEVSTTLGQSLRAA